MAAREESSTVTRAVQVLLELSRSPRGVAVSDLAERVGTQRAPLYRILRSLERARFVRRDDRRLYHLSFGLVPLAEAAAEPLEVVVRPRLAALADETGCTAMLLVRTDDDAVVTALCTTPSTPGLHVTTAPGFVHEGRLASRVAIEMGRHPEPTDPDDVQRARARGYAASGDAAVGGRYGVAVPVDVDGLAREGCLLLVTLDEADPETLAPPLLAAASALSVDLGRS